MSNNRHRLSKFVLVATFTLAIIIGCSIAAVAATGQKESRINVISNELELAFNVTEEPKATPKPTPQSKETPSTTEELTIVVDTGDGSQVSTANINRTTNADGTKHDKVFFLSSEAKTAVDLAKASGGSTARIVIPDMKDEVSQLEITIDKNAIAELAAGGLDLEIYTDNGKIIIPNSSLQNATEDFYFRVVPIKDETERQEVEERATVEAIVKEFVGDDDVKVVARPMTIETNLTSRAVHLVLPLLNVTLPIAEQERAAFLEDLFIFIEHTDGDRVIVKPEVVTYKDGMLGLSFGVTKFSTFTILNMASTKQHQAYMVGYVDGTFRPNKAISRAELAAILQRLEAGAGQKSSTAHPYSDVSNSHWAYSAIQYVSTKGELMIGYPEGTFRPEQGVTRGEFAMIISRWLGLHGDVMSGFYDISNSDAEQEIALVEQAGLLKGYADGSFRPSQLLTRAEAVTVINKIIQRNFESWTSSSWMDVPATHWALKDIEEASITHLYKQELPE